MSTSKIWVLAGTCSNDPDVYPGVDVVPGKTLEWQISDGPSGERGFSSDTIDPLEVIGIVSQEAARRGIQGNAEVVFGSPQELAFFLKAITMRIMGVPILQLDQFPGHDWLPEEDVSTQVDGLDAVSASLRDAVNRDVSLDMDAM